MPTSAGAGNEGDGSLAKEEQLAIFSRYGNQNKTWVWITKRQRSNIYLLFFKIEEMVGKSSLALEDGIGQSSLRKH
jgi:hypothetical protein